MEGPDGGHDAPLVQRARNGDGEAFAELFRLWFDRCWNVAWGILRDQEVAAEVAQDTFLVAWQRLDTLRDAHAFGGWILRIARNRALNRQARERRSAASDLTEIARLADRRSGGTAAGSTLAERRDRRELVWAASQALGDRDASLLDLHLRHGLTPAELAAELGVTANSAYQMLYRLRARLGAAVGHYLLWRSGRPTCPRLRDVVGDDPRFGPDVDRAVARHLGGCADCREAMAAMVRPEELLTGLPLLAVPDHLRATALQQLEANGVPVTGHRPSAPSRARPDGSTGSTAGPEVPGLAPTPIPDSAPSQGSGIGRGTGRAEPPARRRGRRRSVVTAAAGLALVVAAAVAVAATRPDGGQVLASAEVAGDPGGTPPTGPAPTEPAPSITDGTAADAPGSGPTAAVVGSEPAPAAPATASGTNPTTSRTSGTSTTRPAADPAPVTAETVTKTSVTGTPAIKTTVTKTTVTRTTVTRAPADTGTMTVTVVEPPPDSGTVTVTKPKGKIIVTPTPTDAPPAALPSIDARLARSTTQCADGRAAYTATWNSDGTSSSLEVRSSPPKAFPGKGGSGSATVCAPIGTVLRVTATGPGGTATQDITMPR